MTDEGRGPASRRELPPWSRRLSVPVDRARLRAWRSELDARHAREQLELGTWGRDPARLCPGLSAVVLARRWATGLDQTLGSLAGLAVDDDRLEVVVVFAGPSGQATSALAAFRAARPSIPLRVIRLGRIDAARCDRSWARDAGVAAVTRAYTTVVDGGDAVSATFAAALLDQARPRVVPVASMVDPDDPRGPETLTSPDWDAAREPAAHVRDPAGKAFDSGLLKQLAGAPELRGAPEVVFWTAVAVRGQLAFRNVARPATYHRRRAAPADADAAMADPSPFVRDVAAPMATVARLDRLAEVADAPGRRLVRLVVDEQCRPIARYLAANPGQSGRVAAELDRYPVSYLPHRMINEGHARGLVVAYAFPPYADASAVVSAKRLRERAQVADVISNAMDAIRGIDATTELIARPYVARSAALDTPTHFSRWRAIERFSVAGLRTIEKWADHHPYEWMYSRATFAASHLLAAAQKLRQPEIVWTAEFSDPLSRDVHNHERGAPVKPCRLVDELRAGLSRLGRPLPATANGLAWCEELPYALADELVFTNTNQLEHMLGYCTDPELAAHARARSVVRPHPTPPARFYRLVDADYPLEEGVVHLGYFGKFYPQRGLDDVLTAAATLPPATRPRLRIHVFTRRHADLRSRAAELGVDEQVRVGPYVGYLEFLNLTTKLDCLVVNDVATGGTHEVNPYLPSKWSDYRGSGTPVWGLVEAGSPLSGEPLDHASPVGDVAAAREVLERLVATRADAAASAAGRVPVTPSGWVPRLASAPRDLMSHGH